MEVIVEKDGNLVCIVDQVTNSHKLLAIKEAIERCLHIPVSRQTLFFEGRVLHNDHLQVGQYNIVHNSRLQLFVSSNPNQVRHQTQQSIPYHQDWRVMMRRSNNNVSLPSNLTQQTIPYHQDWSVMMRRSNNNVSLPSNLTQQSIPYHQDWPVMMRRSNNNVSLPSNLTQQSIPYHQDWPPVTGGSSRNRNQVVQPEKSPVVTSRNLHGQNLSSANPNMQRYWPQKISKVKDFAVMIRSNKNESQSLSATEELLGIQDCWPMLLGGEDRALTTEQLSKNQNDRPVTTHKKVTRMEAKRINNESSSPPKYNIGWLFSPSETEESSTSDDSVKEIINIPDSPVQKKMKTNPTKMTVMVQPFGETRKIPVEVNVDDNVEELRKELVKMKERGELDLPQEGYFFIHKQSPLTESSTFSLCCIADGDTIEIEIFRQGDSP